MVGGDGNAAALARTADRLPPRAGSHVSDILARRFSALQRLSERELGLLRTIGNYRERHFTDDELVAQGAVAHRPQFIRSGWACRRRVLADGRRQILSFLLPGDPIGLSPRLEPELSDIVALTPVETIDARPVLVAAQSGSAPGLVRALRLMDRNERRLLLDQVVRLGRQSAYERTAHLLIELQQRLQVVGLGDRERFPLPVNQEVLADALGLSIVHVNRTLQQLRRERLIELRAGVAVLLNPQRLAEIADYPLDQAPTAAATSRAQPGGVVVAQPVQGGRIVGHAIQSVQPAFR